MRKGVIRAVKPVALLVGVAAVVLWGQWVGALSAHEHPPRIDGDGGALARLLGSGRLALSEALQDKADEYFHGGVRHSHCAVCAAEHAAEHTVGEHEHSGAHTPPVYDLWSRINAQVHIQEHRHLHGADNRELLPWLWGACRAAPENIEAYESAAYVIEKMLNQPTDAVVLLQEAIAKNPDAARLEVMLGEIALRSLKDPTLAERAFTAAFAKWSPAGGQPSEDERALKGKIIFYLGYLALQRGDTPRARELLALAEREAPTAITTLDLRRLTTTAP